MESFFYIVSARAWPSLLDGLPRSPAKAGAQLPVWTPAFAGEHKSGVSRVQRQLRATPPVSLFPGEGWGPEPALEPGLRRGTSSGRGRPPTSSVARLRRSAGAPRDRRGLGRRGR